MCIGCELIQLIINDNISAIKALRSNEKAEKALDKASGKLQSGLRIRSAMDDSANLGISEKMRAQIRGLAQASRNIQDGISLVQTADGALGSINDPNLERMRALAVQAANGTLTDDDRQRIQEELEQVKANLHTIFRDSEFNTQKIFTQFPPQRQETDIYPSPGVLQGDTILSDSGLGVTTGENQTMTFKLDGVSYAISLTSGSHTPQQLLDEINQKLHDAGTDVTAFYSGRNIAFNSPTKVIDGFGGDMMEINDPYTSILYDMAKHGEISGAAVSSFKSYSGGVMTTITTDTNDTLTFTVDGVDTSVTLAAGTYNQADLLTEINQQFTDNNINVTASYAGSSLQLMHNISGAGHTLTNVGGNGYKDLFLEYTTLSELIVPGAYITAGITGNKDLSAGVSIVAGDNDQLTFFVDGSSHTINLQAGNNRSVSDIVDDLNSKFSSAVLPLTAASSSGQLTISYNDPGNHIVNKFSGSACADLLYGIGSPTVQPGGYKYIEGDSTPQPNGYATVTGVTDISGGATVVTGENDTFSFHLDGADQTIVVAAGNYTASDLVSEINSKLTGLNVGASLLYGTYLTFTNAHEGGGITQFPYSLDSFSGNGYDALMKATIPIPVPGVESKAYVEGRANLASGLEVTAANNTLQFQVNGADVSITLADGTYTQAGLLNAINNILVIDHAGVTASYSGNYLKLSATSSGNFEISNFTGNAADSLLRTKDYVGWVSYSYPSATDAYVDGRKVLTAGADIHKRVNDTLAFALNGTMQSITLPGGYYDADGLLAAVNQQLTAAALPITASYNAKQQLRLTYSPGVNGSFVIDQVGGNASYTLFYPGPLKSVTTEYDAEPMKSVSMLKIQIGANAGVSINSGIPIYMNERTLGVRNVDVSTLAGAEAASVVIDQAIGKVSEKRAAMGSLQNALEYTWNNVMNYQEQMTKAESNIRDTEIAQEMVEQVRSSVLFQASTAMLTHTNQNPQSVLQLLQSSG